MTKERKAEIARINGAKSKGPITDAGKDQSKRNAITHGQRATALKLLVPPHSACLANEDRQAFYKLYDILTAKYRPSDDAELLLTREIADFQWKLTRNKQVESAIFNRELLRQAARVIPSMPELRDLEITVAAHEALTGNRTIFELRKDTQLCLRSLNQLQRRLLQLQKNWPASNPLPPTTEQDRQANTIDDEDNKGTNQPTETDPPQPTVNTNKSFDVTGPVTENVVKLYTEIFHPKSLELVGHEPIPTDKAA